MIMKTFTYIILIIILFNYSCKKESSQFHFHGRVTAACDNQTPIANCNISIIKEYDKGQTFSVTVGTAFTDNDGYYSLETSVPQDGKLIGYKYIYDNFNDIDTPGADNLFFYDTDYSSIKENDVDVNLSAQNFKAYKFHIKNTNPVNSDDEFNSLIIYNDGENDPYELFAETDLYGINIDTTIIKFFWKPSLQYKYSFTKNNVLNDIPLEAIPNPNCLDTLTIDIFY